MLKKQGEIELMPQEEENHGAEAQISADSFDEEKLAQHLDSLIKSAMKVVSCTLSYGILC